MPENEVNDRSSWDRLAAETGRAIRRWLLDRLVAWATLVGCIAFVVFVVWGSITVFGPTWVPTLAGTLCIPLLIHVCRRIYRRMDMD